MKKYVTSIFIISIAVFGYLYSTQEKESLLSKTIEHNNKVYDGCFVQETYLNLGWSSVSGGGSWATSSGLYQNLSDTERYRQATDCWKSQRKFTPDDLFLTVPKYLVDEGKCAISQSEDDHVRPERGGMYATDIACRFEGQGVYAPDYLNDMKEYVIESVWTDSLLWNFVILSFKDWTDERLAWSSRWYFGHTVLDSKWKVGDTIQTWVRFAHADLSGATTGWHTHIELRRMYDGVWQSVRYVTRFKELALEKKRTAIPVANAAEENTYYFTHYALWDEKQNDGDPCISADGKDSCKAHATWRGTMALTVDIRNKIGVKFGDKVALTWDVGCEGVYTVTDEMNCRFRWPNAWHNGPCYYSDKVTPTPKISNILRPGTPYYIKWDLPGRPGGACSIKKL